MARSKIKITKKSILSLLVLVAGLAVSSILITNQTKLTNKAVTNNCSSLTQQYCETSEGCKLSETYADCTNSFPIEQCPTPNCYVKSESYDNNCSEFNNSEYGCKQHTPYCEPQYSSAYCTYRNKASDQNTCNGLSYQQCNSRSYSKKCKWEPVRYLSCEGTYQKQTCVQNPNEEPPRLCQSCPVIGIPNTKGCKDGNLIKYSANGCSDTILQYCSTGTTCKPPDIYVKDYHCG